MRGVCGVRVLACLPLAFLLAANQCGQTGMWPRCAHVRHDKAQNTHKSICEIHSTCCSQADNLIQHHLHVQRLQGWDCTQCLVFIREKAFHYPVFNFHVPKIVKNFSPPPPLLCASCGQHPLPSPSAVTLPWAYLYFKYPKLLLIMRRGRGRKKVFVRSVFALFSFFFRVSLDSPE